MAQHGHFLWCDLSSYRPDVTRPFYSDLFGWRFSGDGYAMATDGAAPVAAIFEMPQKSQDMGLPSFWMSYMGVRDADAAVETAKALGGKVEVGPLPFDGGGRFALIRDPLGAGFTAYEGDALEGRGNRLGHTLVVSDAAAVMPFYTALFGWQFGADSGGTRTIEAGDRTLAHLHEIPDERIRGKEQFWAVLFRGESGSTARLPDLGGSVEAELVLPEGPAAMARDPDQAAFLLLEDGAAASAGATLSASSSGRPPWRAWTALGLIGLAVATGWGWITAIFFAVWIAMAIRDRATFLFEIIERDRRPALFWTTLAVFALLGVLSLFYPGL